MLGINIRLWLIINFQYHIKYYLIINITEFSRAIMQVTNLNPKTVSYLFFNSFCWPSWLFLFNCSSWGLVYKKDKFYLKLSLQTWV